MAEETIETPMGQITPMVEKAMGPGGGELV